MTPELARVVMEWWHDRPNRDVPVGPGAAAVTVKLLPPLKQCPTILLDELVRRFGTAPLMLTNAGWGVPERLLVEMVEQARAVLRDVEKSAALEKTKESAGTKEPTPPAPDPTDMEPPRILKRYGFVIWRLCDPREVDAQLKRVSDNHRERKRVLEALKARPFRYLPRTTPAHVRKVMDLRDDFPNFSEVIEVLADGLSLRARMKAPLKLPPTLLMGAPGLGKTAFSKELARRLGFELCVRSLAEMTAAFVLIGGSSSWSESRPGLIAVLLADMPDGKAPLLMLDELDKARSGSSFPPDVALLGLMEDHTAKAFREENLDLALNLEPMSYLLTGNRLEHIRPEILSRLRKAEIRMPTQAEMHNIVSSVDSVLRREVPGLAAAFAPLSEEVMGSLSVMPPRQLRAVLQAAYSRVARRDFRKSGRLTVTLGDLQVGLDRESEKVKLATQGRRYVMPLLMINPDGWWRVH